MLFNSIEFLAFYLVVVAAYFAMADRFRWVLLLAASYWFYMSWRPEYVVLILASTLVNYAVGIGLERSEAAGRRRLLLTLGIVSSLSLLFTFKYLDFFNQSVEATLRAFSLDVSLPVFQLILPLGISFYTFQAVGYTIDVYRRSVPAERHFGYFALYVSFFPQLIAGPIERSGNLLPQFRKAKQFHPEQLADGLRLILWGLFKKVVIADQIARVVDAVYADPSVYPGAFLLLATVFFAVQIYCDFSGYSDMAVGTARILGYELMTNFRRPYFATSIPEFWRRWHISLSTWFRDYVYVPLGGNRVTRPLWVRNILIVFVVSGIWHGANWTFLAWGAIHGLCMVFSRMTERVRNGVAGGLGLAESSAPRVLFQRALVLGIVVIAWVFFRAQSLEDAGTVLSGIMAWEPASLATLWRLGLPRFEMMIACLAIGVLFAVEALVEKRPGWLASAWGSRPLRWACYATAFYAIVFFGVFGQIEFIYFQF